MATVLLSAGDASGELHAAALVEALRRRRPEARFLGLGGAEMEKAGVEIVVHQRELAVGALGVFRDLPRIVSAWRRLGRALEESSPELVVLVDSPDFNLPFARRARAAGARILYYVSPQVWAWRRGRIAKLAHRVDRLAVIFPFERALYAGTGLTVEFVGHPLLDRLPPPADRAERTRLREELGVARDAPLVALLPGSRRNELAGGLPLQLDAARALAAERPDVRFALALAPSLAAEAAEPARSAARAGLPVSVHVGRTWDVVRAADVALAKPGTVTVEVALLGTPLVVALRVDALTAFAARRLLRVEHFAMPNLVLGERVVPELMQQDAEPEAIARALADLLDGPTAARQRERLADLRERLGGGGAAERAAEIADEMLAAVLPARDGGVRPSAPRGGAGDGPG